MNPCCQRFGEYTRVIRICRFVNSSKSAAVHGAGVAAKHSGQNTMGFPVCSSAKVIAKSSLSAPFQASKTLASSNVFLRIAVPPPQQKSPVGFPNIVAMAAFQAEAIELASRSMPEPLGMIQRY